MRYAKLYPNRLELHPDSAKPEMVFMDQVEEVSNELVQVKNEQCIIIRMRDGKIVLTNPVSCSCRCCALYSVCLTGRDRPKGVADVAQVGAQAVAGAAGFDGEEGGQDLRHGFEQQERHHRDGAPQHQRQLKQNGLTMVG